MKKTCALFLFIILVLTLSVSVGKTLEDYSDVDLQEIQNSLVLFWADGHLGYADLAGNVVIDPVYSLEDRDSRNVLLDGAYSFDGNHVMVSDGYERFVIDTSGNRVQFPVNYEKIGMLKDGVVWLSTSESSFTSGLSKKVGYYSADGREIIPPSNDLPTGVDYYNGMLLHANTGSLLKFSGRSTVWDTQGNRHELFVANASDVAQALGVSEDTILNADVCIDTISKGQHTGERYTPCMIKLKKAGTDKTIATLGAYVAANGEVYCDPFDDYTDPHLLHNDVAYYGKHSWYKNERKDFWGVFLDHRFNVLFSLKDNPDLWAALQYDQASRCTFTCGSFNDGIVVAQMERGYTNGSKEVYCFALNKEGAFVFEPRNDIRWGSLQSQNDAYSVWFSSGLCPAQDVRSGKWGYISSDGQWKIKPIFEQVSNFTDDCAIVTVVRDLVGFGQNKTDLLIHSSGAVLYPSKERLIELEVNVDSLLEAGLVFSNNLVQISATQNNTQPFLSDAIENIDLTGIRERPLFTQKINGVQALENVQMNYTYSLPNSWKKTWFWNESPYWEVWTEVSEDQKGKTSAYLLYLNGMDSSPDWTTEDPQKLLYYYCTSILNGFPALGDDWQLLQTDKCIFLGQQVDEFLFTGTSKNVDKFLFTVTGEDIFSFEGISEDNEILNMRYCGVYSSLAGKHMCCGIALIYSAEHETYYHSLFEHLKNVYSVETAIN